MGPSLFTEGQLGGPYTASKWAALSKANCRQLQAATVLLGQMSSVPAFGTCAQQQPVPVMKDAAKADAALAAERLVISKSIECHIYIPVAEGFEVAAQSSRGWKCCRSWRNWQGVGSARLFSRSR